MNKKLNKVLLSLALILTFGATTLPAEAYSVERKMINKSYTGTNSRDVIVLHESGNPNNVGANSLDNEVAYMSRNWFNANAHYFVGGGGRVVQLLEDYDLGYHAGSWANGKGIGIELARTNNKARFEKDYVAYVELIRNLSTKYGIPKELDSSNFNKGIKSHLWISNNVWGDHSDPYGYLTQWGVNKSKLAIDIKNGFGSKPQPPVSKPPIKPTPPKPAETTIKKGSKVIVTKAIQYDNGKAFKAKGVYTVLEVKGSRVVIGKGNVITAAVHFNNLKYGTETPAKPKPPTKPSKPVSGWVAENATFTPYQAVNVRTGTSTSHTITGTVYNPYGIRYNAVKQANGYVWIRYESFTGTRYMAVRPIGGQAFGTFK